MTSSPNEFLSRALDAFGATAASSNQWRGKCPICGHSSLLISVGDKQPVTAWCSKECDKKAVNAAVYKAAGLELDSKAFTVTRFCEMKKLPRDWVVYYFAVLDDRYVPKTGKPSKNTSVCFTYMNEDFSSAGRKFRFSENSHKTAWMDYDPDRAIPYGLQAVKFCEENGIDTSTVYIVEGESDTITLAYVGLCALGISGAPHGWKDRFAKIPVLEKAKNIVVIQEPDAAGEKFVQKVAASFPRGKVWSMRLPAKDASELWITSKTEEDFAAAWNKAIDEAMVVGSAPDTGEYTVEKLSSITPKPITWLWPGRIPKGKLTVFAGNPGVGKGLATCSLAAIATTGGQYPDEAIAEHDPIEVLMMFCEDDAEDTVVPRLMAAGADLDRIFRIKATVVGADSTKSERELAFDTDLKILKRFLADHPSVKLVIVDPISSYLGKTKSNDEQEVRRVLVPLADLANETGVTFVLVAHFNKRSDVAALHKIMGAVAMTGVARATWLFTEDKEDEDDTEGRYLMLQGKLNVGRKQKGLEYTIGSKRVLPEPAETTGAIIWGNATDVTADKALGSIGAFGDAGGSKVKAAGEWIVEFLGDGEKPATEVWATAKAAGIAEKTLKRAKKEVGVVTAQRDDAWFWRLPRSAVEEQMAF